MTFGPSRKYPKSRDSSRLTTNSATSVEQRNWSIKNCDTSRRGFADSVLGKLYIPIPERSRPEPDFDSQPCHHARDSTVFMLLPWQSPPTLPSWRQFGRARMRENLVACVVPNWERKRQCVCKMVAQNTLLGSPLRVSFLAWIAVRARRKELERMSLREYEME